MQRRSLFKPSNLFVGLAILSAAWFLVPTCITWTFPAPQVDAAPPYPPSPIIRGITWAPISEIRRGAAGSDNFPITWGDDDLLYTSFGDGFGFRPFVDQKLSMCFASVDGFGTDFVGVNIRSIDEQTGHGRTGWKASSLLMVDGVLLMWVRNADKNGRGCLLAWSTDKAVTWTWGDWTIPELGYCVFPLVFNQYQL